jgi:hypothetical protein
MVGPYDSRQEWIANAFYKPPKVGRHRSWCAPGSIEKSGITGCIYETGEQCCLLADDSSAQRRELIVAALRRAEHSGLWPPISIYPFRISPDFRK